MLKECDADRYASSVLKYDADSSPGMHAVCSKNVMVLNTMHIALNLTSHFEIRTPVWRN